MQPQQSSSPSPSPKYDFILKDQPKTKRSFKIPTLGLPRKAALALEIALVGFVIIILYAVVFGNKTNNTETLVNAAARAQEIVRVSKIAEPLAHNPDTQELIATTEASLSSQQVQMTAYLAGVKVKVGAKNLALYLNSSSDSDIQSAAQNNNLDSAYASYLKQGLMTYKTELQTAAKGAPLKRIQLLNDAFQSTDTLLSAPQLASSNASQ